MASHTCGSFEKAERCRSPVKKQDPASTATVANTTLIYLPKTTFPKIRLSASMGGHYNSARITPVGLARIHAGYVTTPNFRAPLPHRGQNSLGPGDRKRTFCFTQGSLCIQVQLFPLFRLSYNESRFQKGHSSKPEDCKSRPETSMHPACLAHEHIKR